MILLHRSFRFSLVARRAAQNAVNSLWFVFALLLSLVVSSPANSATTTFSATGSYSYTVPAGVTRLQVQVAGGGGGGGGFDVAATGKGGNGALVTVTLNVTPGQVLSGTIGAGGITGWTSGGDALYIPNCSGGGSGGTGFSSGGIGGNANCSFATGFSGGGGGGGGSTSMLLAGTSLVQAAGGGGGGGSTNGGIGGAGGNSSAFTIVATCGTVQTGGTGGSWTGDGGGGGGGGGGYAGGTGGVAATDGASPSGGLGGTSCYSSNAAVLSGTVTTAGGVGANGQTVTGTASNGAGANGWVTINTLPTLTITKISNGGAAAFTFTGTNGWSSQTITTVTSGVGGGGATQTFTTPALATTITEAATAGYTMTAASCSGLGSGGTVTPNLVLRTLSFDAAAIAWGADIACTVTNTRTPTLKLQKISYGGNGNFNFFTSTNLASAPGTLTTTADGVAAPVSPTAINITTIGTAVTITETVPTGYAITGFSCTDSNSSVTGNTGTFGTFAGAVVTVPASFVKAGATLSCTVTNTRARIRFQKITLGGTGTFSFTSTSNLQGTPGSMTTSSSGIAAPASPVPVNANNIGTQITVTESAVAGYVLTAVVCTDANSTITGNTGNFGTFAGSTVTIASSYIKAGAEISCTITNTLTPTFRLQLRTIGGFGGPFSFSQTNLASTPGPITTVAVNTATPVSPTAINISSIGTAVTITTTLPSSFSLTSVSCTDSNSALTGNTGTFGNLASNLLTVAAGNITAGASLTCVLTAGTLPTITLTQISIGGTSGFTFTGTNGWSSQTITTTSSGVGVTGATQQLAAAATATTITQAIPSGYIVTAINCSGFSSGNVTPNLAGGSVTFDASAAAAGNALACTFTNEKIAIFKIQVISQAGFGGPMHFSQTNLASAPPDVTWGATNVLTPASPVPINVSATGTAVTVSQIVEYRYATVAASCTDANSAITGNTGSFGSLSGPLGFETLTIPASRVLAGADFDCILTVKRITRIAVSVVTSGGTGTTDLTLPTNQPNQSIATTSPNVPVSGIASYFTTLDVDNTISVTPPSGFVLSSVTCIDTDPAGPWGSGTLSMNATAGTFTLVATQVVFGANYACTITTSKVPVVRLQVRTLGGSSGPFAFTQTNLASTPAAITTVAINTATPASPAAINISAIGTAVTLTAAPPIGYDLNAASCSDANSAITGNTGSFGTLATNVLTLAGGNTIAGADITCLLTSNKLPTVALTVISNGMAGNFDISGTNGFGSQTITTLSPGVGVTGATKILAAASTATTLTELMDTSYIMISANCSGLSSGTPTVDLSSGTISLAAAALDPGTAIACTITNEAANPVLSLANSASPASIASAGSAIAYTLTVSNAGNVTISAITLTDAAGTVVCATSGNATVAMLVPAATEICTLSYTASQTDFDSNGGGDGDIDNTASAQASYGPATLNASASSTVLLVITPQLSIVKSADTAGPVSANDVITYSYRVTNTGNVTIGNVVINDSHIAFGTPPVPDSETLSIDAFPLGNSADAATNGSWDTLAPGDTVVFNSTYSVVQADIDNQ